MLPVKVKWLALLTWIGYFFTLAFGSTVARLMVAASVCNFLLFFWRDILLRVRSGRFRMADQAKRMRTAAVARHTCVVCGATNLSARRPVFATARSVPVRRAIATNTCTITSIWSRNRGQRSGLLLFRRKTHDSAGTILETGLVPKSNRRLVALAVAGLNDVFRVDAGVAFAELFGQ